MTYQSSVGNWGHYMFVGTIYSYVCLLTFCVNCVVQPFFLIDISPCIFVEFFFILQVDNYTYFFECFHSFLTILKVFASFTYLAHPRSWRNRQSAYLPCLSLITCFCYLFRVSAHLFLRCVGYLSFYDVD